MNISSNMQNNHTQKQNIGFGLRVNVVPLLRDDLVTSKDVLKIEKLFRRLQPLGVVETKKPIEILGIKIRDKKTTEPVFNLRLTNDRNVQGYFNSIDRGGQVNQSYFKEHTYKAILSLLKFAHKKEKLCQKGEVILGKYV